MAKKVPKRKSRGAREFSALVSQASGRMDRVFDKATAAKDILVKLSKDPRFKERDNKDIRAKIDAVTNAVDIILDHT